MDVALKDTVKAYIYGSDHPDLEVYRKDFDTKFDIDYWLTGMLARCELGGFRGKRILEVGCGFGWDAVALSLLGQNKVVATDILPSMVEGTQECLDTMKKNGNALNIEAVQGDICSLDLPDNSFDGIYSSEAIEHVHNLKAMFDRCLALLKPGGRLLIYNDSNRYNSDFRESTFRMWEERDTSWDHARWLEAEIRPVEHKGAKPYAAMREAIIDEAAPEIDPDARSRLVSATAGMIRPQIFNAVKTYLKDGKLPIPPKFSWCRNPETGEYAERLLDPFELRDMLKAAGFKKVKLRHAFNKFPFRLANGVSLRPLNKFLFDRRGMFVLSADKPKG